MQNAPYPLYPVDQGNNLRQFVSLWTEKNKDKVAFRYQNENRELVEISYSRFAEDIAALGTAFLNLGLNNAKIAVIGDNSYDWILAYFAATNSGNVIVPLDRDLSSKEIEYLLGNSESRVIVYTEKYEAMLREMAPRLPHLQHYFVVGQAGEAWRQLRDKGHALLQEGDAAFDSVVIDDDALTALLYTSGTTGVSKGVMLSHRNLTSDVIATLMNVELTGVTLLVLPLHHSFTLATSVLCSLHSGCTIAISKSLKELSADLQFFKPHYLFLVPVLVEALHKRIIQAMRKAGRESWLSEVIAHSDALCALGVDLRRVIFKSLLEALGGELRFVVSGGAALDPSLIGKYASLGIDLRNGYGTTECSPVLSVNRNHHHRTGTIGQPLPLCEVMIHEPNEQGEGEICVKGPMVMQGYYNNPAATEAAFIDGWYRTGDMGKLEDGFLLITGRIKNLIILSNGKNIYPEELELLVQGLPGVKEVVVYDDNDLIIVEIFPDAEYLQGRDEMDIQAELQQGIDKINEALPRHKKMADMRIRDREFEKTGSGKIKRTLVKKL